jgi:hypothetical protein
MFGEDFSVRFQIFTAVSVKMSIFWDNTVSVYQIVRRHVPEHRNSKSCLYFMFATVSSESPVFPLLPFY